ncbi:tyrosine-type recombinase/integrase [Gramella sp. MT6]|uniref:tyrosine-type recombinase/integrase n=1 Tax=Gramella sp. MT6 TaxID=2705471 RepID=UPI001C5F791E|nr:tyrosine-type recombinase/integrase [Gramella sp. MT6]QYA25589.1 tyrosine-type recombinase/integrase [Gramella sp. MT6]
MNYSFYLRKPNSNSETLILFSCYFNDEKKKFVYSTKKTILPEHWNSKNKCPNKRGKFVSPNQKQITKRLNEFATEFQKIKSRSELGEQTFDSLILKEHFDHVFERVAKVSSFFEVYHRFTEEKIKLKEWSKSTKKRYKNIKNLLEEFQEVKNYKLTFAKINKKFFIEFTDFCYEYKDHYTNTFSRNVGLFKTFMFWSVKNGYAFNEAFKDFKKPQRVLTRQEALTMDHVKKLHAYNCSTISQEKSKDVFVFQCLTGLRYGELELVNKRIITADDCLFLKESKDHSKPAREIPIYKIALEILQKYDYELPLSTNQEQNRVIKVILRDMGYTHEVEFSRNKGVDQNRFVKPFCDRISTHTARRTFVTILRNAGVADKIIMSITGHRDIKTFNMYHQISASNTVKTVNKVFAGL